MADGLSTYHRAVSAADTTRLTRAEEQALAADIAAAAAPGASPRQCRKGRRAEEQLVTSNLPLALWWATRMRRTGGPELDELVSAANVGLVLGARAFRPGFDAPFSAFARHHVLSEIRRCRRQMATITLPGDTAPKRGRVLAARERLISDLHREPTNAELAAEAGVDPGDIAALTPPGTVNLTETVAYSERCADADAVAPEEWAEARDVGARMRELAERVLTDDEWTVLRLRFGVDGGDPQGMDEVAAAVGVSRQWVGSLEASALAKLRHPSTAAWTVLR